MIELIIQSLKNNNYELFQELVTNKTIDISHYGYNANLLDSSYLMDLVSVYCKSKKIFKYCMSLNIDINYISDWYLGTPLEVALRYNNIDMVQWLLEEGSQIDYEIIGKYDNFEIYKNIFLLLDYSILTNNLSSNALSKLNTIIINDSINKLEKYRYELFEKTMHPSRYFVWCLDTESQKDYTR
jgi:hypothetical protein